jgi:two-component system cell cycle response regulator DivK
MIRRLTLCRTASRVPISDNLSPARRSPRSVRRLHAAIHPLTQSVPGAVNAAAPRRSPVILDASVQTRTHMETPIERPRVLIVEDCRELRTMYRMNLENSGFDVVEAANGVEALMQVRDATPDIILMDLSMPLMDGWELTRHLKGDGRTAGIPIVVLSGRTRDDLAEKAMRAGCVALLTKPCLPSNLVNEVRHCLSA